MAASSGDAGSCDVVEEDPAAGVRYRLADASDTAAVLQLVLSSFYPQMPMYRQLGAGGDPEATRQFVRAALQQRVSLVAADAGDGSVVGASVNTVERGGGDDLQWPEPRPQFAGQRTILRCVDQVESAVDCFGMFKEERALSLKLLTVAESRGGRGVGRRLWELSLQLAASRRLRLVTVSTESAFSQRICERLGFRPLCRLLFKDFVDGDTGRRPLAGLDATEHKEAVMFAMHLPAASD